MFCKRALSLKAGPINRSTENAMAFMRNYANCRAQIMPEIDKIEQHLSINFQWTVGDTRVLEKNLVELVRKPEAYYIATVVSRMLALLFIFLSCYFLLPKVDFWTVLLISISATFSLWVSWSMVSLSIRALENLSAEDPKVVGWNEIKIDITGILWDNETSQDYVSWQGILDIVFKEGSVWFKTGSVHGYFIPSRVFESEEKFDECVKLINFFKDNATLPAHKHDTENPTVLH